VFQVGARKVPSPAALRGAICAGVQAYIARYGEAIGTLK
jgi:hypothetical protein